MCKFTQHKMHRFIAYSWLRFDKCLHLGHHHPNQGMSDIPKFSLGTFLVRLLSYPGNYCSDLFHHRLVVPVHKLDMNRGIQYVLICVIWGIPLNSFYSSLTGCNLQFKKKNKKQKNCCNAYHKLCASDCLVCFFKKQTLRPLPQSF